MTIRFKPTKKERIEHNMENFDRKVGKLLDYYNAGEISEEQFISEIRVSHGTINVINDQSIIRRTDL